MKHILIVFLAGLVAACSAPLNDNSTARADTASVVSIDAAWMRPHPGGRDVTAAYASLSLVEGDSDVLEAVRIEGAERVEIHDHLMNEAGVMRMVEVGPQSLDRDTPLQLAPGGLHFMVFGLPTVSEGDEVSGVLIFQNAGEVPVVFPVTSSMALAGDNE